MSENEYSVDDLLADAAFGGATAEMQDGVKWRKAGLNPDWDTLYAGVSESGRKALAAHDAEVGAKALEDWAQREEDALRKHKMHNDSITACIHSARGAAADLRNEGKA